ncbi:MAG: hypothetical protein HY974_02970 [Candidatus Kerfeldbacteria bacterium]|nr:hypothetical protein [Candidatus Kerfeldbacteria bacterium]
MLKKEVPPEIDLSEIREIRHMDKSELRGPEEIQRYAEARTKLRTEIQKLLEQGVSQLQTAKILQQEQALANVFADIERWEEKGGYLKRKPESHGRAELKVDDFIEKSLSPRGTLRAVALAEELYQNAGDKAAVVWVGSGQPRSEYTIDIATARFDRLIEEGERSASNRDIISLRLEPHKELGDLDVPKSLLVELRKVVNERTGESTKSLKGGKELMHIWAAELTQAEQRTGVLGATDDTPVPDKPYDTPVDVARRSDKALEEIVSTLPKEKIGDRKVVVVAVTHSGPLWQKKKEVGAKDPYPLPGEYACYTYDRGSKQWSVEYKRVKFPGEGDNIEG